MDDDDFSEETVKRGLRVGPWEKRPRDRMFSVEDSDGIALTSMESPEFLLTGNFAKMLRSLYREPKDK